MLKVGKKAPAFSLVDQDGVTHTHKEFIGTWTVVYFYPKDNTPGCTREACVIADAYKDFKRQQVAVFGVSKDTPRSHKRFAEKYSLPFTLLSDETMEMITKYGAFKEKHMFGKPVRGTHRISYLINPEGKVAKVYPDVEPSTHAHELLTDIKAIRKAERSA